MFLRKKKGVVGLDIGSSAIKLVELKPGKSGRYSLLHAGHAALSPEAIVEGTIMDSSLVVEMAQRLVQERSVKNQNFGISLSGISVAIRKIQVPAMSEAELAESIHWEAEQYLPFDVNEVNLDYVVLGQDADSLDVLLVAAKKDRIVDYTGVVTQLGKAPILVDVDVFALQNAYEHNYGLNQGRVVALVNIGAHIMNVNVLADGQSVF
ncbi:MAG: type IV pilus assembly protein PilM, partial [Acidobacteria bacterium]|nr:type IV pilus assembly protein PilM [Acidobacteriota bacterium]